MSKSNLPNIIGGINYVSEYQEYARLYEKLDRTQSGVATFTSTSSSTSYSTSDYSTDADVYNKGEEGLATLLYKYVLKDFIIDAEWTSEIDGIVDEVNAAIASCTQTFNVTTSYSSGVYTVESGLPGTLPISTYKIRFTAGQAAALNDKIKLSPSGDSLDIKTYTGNISANTWLTGAIVELTISGTTVQADISRRTGGGFVYQSTAPSDTSLLWADSSINGRLKLHDGTSWVTIPGSLGSSTQ